MLFVDAYRVRKGAKLLDKAHPGWEKKIDLGILNIADDRKCALAQVTGSYWDGLAGLKINWDEDPIAYGFLGSNSVRHAALTAAWKKQVEKRRPH